MPDAITAYPLCWPAVWPRTATRESWRGSVTISASLSDLHKEMRLLGVTQLVLSSNVTLGQERPADPGVVAYGFYEKQQIAIPCDRWNTVAGNIRAIAKTVEAMRGMERWGAKNMIRAMFQGFIALPAPAGRHWRDVLGFHPATRHTRDEIEVRRRSLAKQHHPDAGGSESAMAEINAAADAALKEIGA